MESAIPPLAASPVLQVPTRTRILLKLGKTSGNLCSRWASQAIFCVISRLISMAHRKLWTSFLVGQLCSLFICGTAVTSTWLSRKKSVECPTGIASFLFPKIEFSTWFPVSLIAQSFLNYVLMGLVYATAFGWQSSAESGFLEVLRKRWWKYILLAIVDVEANYLMVKAYQFTTLTSVQVRKIRSVVNVSGRRPMGTSFKVLPGIPRVSSAEMIECFEMTGKKSEYIQNKSWMVNLVPRNKFFLL